MASEASTRQPLESFIRTIPDHPKPGILFRDITTLIASPEGFAIAIESLVDFARSESFDLVAGIEARGFVFGAPVARELDIGLALLRKPGKLPSRVLRRTYELEYGHDSLEMHEDAVPAGARVLLVDDLIATGGTAAAGVELLREGGAAEVACAFVVSLPDLGGAARLVDLGCRTHWLCEFEGD